MAVSTFSRRSGLRSEFSGPGEVTDALRNRLKQVAERYVARRYIGIGNEGLWVWGLDLDHRLAMEFGMEIGLSDVLGHGEPHEVLTAVEIYMLVAGEAYKRLDEIRAEFNAAFGLSGSVYYVDRDGRVALRMEGEAAARVEEASKVLTTSAKAKGVFDGAVSGLLSRRLKPEDVVRDVHVAFEEYLKTVTGQKDFADAIQALKRNGVLTSTQAAMMGNLYGFRSETFGPAHAGKARTPTEADALWFVETVSTQLKFLGNVVKVAAAGGGGPRGRTG